MITPEEEGAEWEEAVKGELGLNLAHACLLKKLGRGLCNPVLSQKVSTFEMLPWPHHQLWDALRGLFFKSVHYFNHSQTYTPLPPFLFSYNCSAFHSLLSTGSSLSLPNYTNGNPSVLLVAQCIKSCLAYIIWWGLQELQNAILQ